MAKIAILTETFVADGVNKYGRPVGNCDVSLGHKIVTVRACRTSLGIAVAGFVGRYRTSPKPWLASVTAADDAPGALFVNFGRDDRAGRCHKLQGISYEPATFEGLCNAAYWTAA
jgi:hypothetical protein